MIGVLCMPGLLPVPGVGRGMAMVSAVASGPVPFVSPLEQPCQPTLGRPVGRDAGSNRPSRFYPYGSTGLGQYPVHHGVEFVNPLGTPVLAVADGVVMVARTDEDEAWGPHPGYYGLLVVIQSKLSCSEEEIFTLYGHLSKLQVKRGQSVHRGQVIGLVGMSGVALGPHLHLEVRVGQNTFYHTRNPELWLEPLAGHGIIAGGVRDGTGRPVEGVLVTVHRLAQPDRYWREAWTYLDVQQEKLGSDAFWRENFVLGDVRVGDYVVRIRVHSQLYTRQIAVDEKGVAFVSIRVRGDFYLRKTGINGIILQP